MKLAEEAFRKLTNAFDNVDPEDADIDSAGDVITISFKVGKRCVVNTQRPARQIWLAGGQRAWHFSWNAEQQRWLDDKGTGDELFATLHQIVKDAGGVELTF